jgi:peptidoglycan-N-acetylglucosamine deacetylase
VDWPHGKRAAAAFTFDVDAESLLLATDPANALRPGLLSQAIYGPRVGVPLLLEVLANHGVRGSFFIPGVNVELYPETLKAIVEAGHEIGLHGYTHTSPARLTRDQESEELDKAFRLLTGAGGLVTGYRSPSWEVSPHTLDLLEAKGLTYSSQFMDDFRPYRHPGRRLIELPVQWILDDWPHFAYNGEAARTIRSTVEVETIWKEEFAGIRAHGGTFILTLHPEVSGRPARVALLDRMIEHVRRCDDVWIATCGEIAAHANRQLPDQVAERPAGKGK